ncbi:MAG TPA: hypothetical protein VF763_11965 [Candidatus Limnocylindrales bacterium]
MAQNTPDRLDGPTAPAACGLRARLKVACGWEGRKRRKALPTATIFAAVVLATSPISVSAVYTRDLWYGTYSPQATTYYCVAASTLSWLGYIPNSTRPTQTTIYNYERQHMASPLSIGVDPRGWAYGMWYYTPAGYGFQDYDYPSNQQAQANGELEMGIRATGQPVGAIVAAGDHAYLVIGFQASSDPNFPGSSLYGFYVIDPWYGSGLGNIGTLPGGGPYNIAPNSYVTLSNWNAHYFLPDVNEGSYYYQRYDTILRSSSSNAPAGGRIGIDNPPASWADVFGGAPVTPVQPALQDLSDIADLREVVLTGLQQNELTRGNALGIDFRGVSVGSSVHVDSAASEFPSYFLVEIKKRARTVAVAMVTEEAGFIEFAGLRATETGFRLPDESYRAELAKAYGISATRTRLAWAWSDETMDPYLPVVEVATESGQWHALLKAGDSGVLHLSPSPSVKGAP